MSLHIDLLEFIVAALVIIDDENSQFTQRLKSVQKGMLFFSCMTVLSRIGKRVWLFSNLENELKIIMKKSHDKIMIVALPLKKMGHE